MKYIFGTVLVFGISIALICYLNRDLLSEGICIDKKFIPAHEKHWAKGTHHYPNQWEIEIEGKYEGKIIDEWHCCPREYYRQISIGTYVKFE